ncbi:hypothetical protein B0H14DRAFT_3133151 [Mycena olivaceomarginata]|nr:hypothetical protein B0H14DRAFT_3133151 [Mycena olivaceomarginata]
MPRNQYPTSTPAEARMLGGGMAERIEDRRGARMGWDGCSADSGECLQHMLRTQVVLGTEPRRARGQDESGVGDGEQLQRVLLRTMVVTVKRMGRRRAWRARRIRAEGWDGERGVRGGAAAAGAGDVGAMFGMRLAARAVCGVAVAQYIGLSAQRVRSCVACRAQCGGTVDSATAGAAGSRGGWRTSRSSEAETDEAKERRWEVLHGGPADSCAAEGRPRVRDDSLLGIWMRTTSSAAQAGRRAWGCSSVECRPGRRRGDASTVVARGGRMVVGRRREGEWGCAEDGRRRREARKAAYAMGNGRRGVAHGGGVAHPSCDRHCARGFKECDVRDEERQRAARGPGVEGVDEPSHSRLPVVSELDIDLLELLSFISGLWVPSPG